MTKKIQWGSQEDDPKSEGRSQEYTTKEKVGGLVYT